LVYIYPQNGNVFVTFAPDG